MALTQTRTETDSTTDSTETSDPASRPALERVLSTSDHKTIGRMWIGAGSAIALLALVLSTIASLELVDLDTIGLFEDEGQFVQAWSAGRTLLLFGGIVPVLVGLATYLTPLQVGASAIAFGRGAAGAFWTWLLATWSARSCRPGQWWTSRRLERNPVLLWILALGTMLVGFCWAFVCIATTILGARTVGMRSGAGTNQYLVLPRLRPSWLTLPPNPDRRARLGLCRCQRRLHVKQGRPSGPAVHSQQRQLGSGLVLGRYSCPRYGP